MTVNTTSPFTVGGDYSDNLTDLFRRVQKLEQQAQGMVGTGPNPINNFPNGIVIGSGAGTVVLGTAISAIAGLTVASGAYLSDGYMDVSWTLPDSTVADVEIFYALKSINGLFYDIARSVMVASSDNAVRIQPLLTGRTYGVYVVPRNNIGVAGTPTPPFSGGFPSYHDIAIPADSTVPPALANLQTSLGADSLVAAWTPVPADQLDVLDGGYYEVQLDDVSNSFTSPTQKDWRGQASVMAFDGVHAQFNVNTTLAMTPLPSVNSISNVLSGITSAVAGAGTFTIALSAGHNVKVNEIIVLSGFTPSNYNGTWWVQSVTSTSVTLVAAAMTAGAPGAATVMGTGYNATKWTYTFSANHGLGVGDFFDTVGFTPAVYNIVGQQVFGVPNSTTLTVLNSVNPSGPVTIAGTAGYGIKGPLQTNIMIASAAGLPPTSFVIYNGSEEMLVTGGFGTTTLTVTRGYNASTPQQHSLVGSAVSTGAQATNYWLRVRAVSVGGIGGPWTVAAGGGAIPAGGVLGNDILARSIQAVSIVANSITANEIAAGTITAAQIAAGTITATQLGAIQLLVGQYIRSSNYLAGTQGWNIDQGGNAEFNNVVVRGTIISSTVVSSTINGATINGTTINGSTIVGNDIITDVVTNPRIEILHSSGFAHPHLIGGGSSTSVNNAINFYGMGSGANDAIAPAYIGSLIDLGGFTGLQIRSEGGSGGNWAEIDLNSSGINIHAQQSVNVASNTNVYLTQGNAQLILGGNTLTLTNGATLHLQGGELIMDYNIAVWSYGGGTNNWLWSGGDGRFNISWSNSLTNYTSMNAFAYFTTSDASLKDQIIDVADSHLIHQLRPVAFEWKDKMKDQSPGTHYGFLAQEVQSVLPGLVSEVVGPHQMYTTEEKAAAHKAGRELPAIKAPGQGLGLHTMNYMELIPLLIAEVQKLRKEVNTLQGAR